MESEKQIEIKTDRFLAAQHRFQYIISSTAIVDMITILPLFFTSIDNAEEIAFQKITIIFRSLRLTRVVNKFFKIGDTEVSQQIFKIFLTILTLLFVTAGVLEVFENPVRDDMLKDQTAYILSNHEPLLSLERLTF